MTSAKDKNSSGTLEKDVEYRYDALGNRVEQDVTPYTSGTAGTTVVSRFAYDMWKASGGHLMSPEYADVWADLNGSSSLIIRYMNGDGIDQHFARMDYASSTYTPSWLFTDNEGSIRSVVDSTGHVVKTASYDVFGNMTVTGSGDLGHYAYSGRDFDAETNLQNNRAREYNPAERRWMTEDPEGFYAGDSNLYRYVNNAPTDATDPSGNVAVLFRGFAGGSSGKYSSGALYASGPDSQPGGQYGGIQSAAGKTPGGAADDYDLYNWVDKKYDYQDVNAAVKFIVDTVGSPKDQKEPIVIVGHSYGGTSAIAAAKALQDLGYTVDLLATLDAITAPVQNIANGTVGQNVVGGGILNPNAPIAVLNALGAFDLPVVEKPGNVTTSLNWHQDQDNRGAGTIIKGGNNFCNTTASKDIPNNNLKKGQVLGHTDIDDDPAIASKIQQAYGDLKKNWKPNPPLPPPVPAPPSLGATIVDGFVPPALKMFWP